MHAKRPGHVPGRAFWGCLLVLLSAAPACAQVGAQDDAALLRLLAAPGSVGLMRHARAPGTGDPPGFRLGDCATQRNLDDAGRDQARRLGQRLRAAGLAGAAAYASPWCRTMETAALLGLGPVTPLPALASFYGGKGEVEQQTAALRAALQAGRDGPPRIMVTHQVNVTALTGVFPDDAELIVMRPGPSSGGTDADGYAVVGRLRAPP